MARMITTQQDYALRALLDEADDLLAPADPGNPDDVAARERILAEVGSIHSREADPLESDNHAERLLHAAMYDCLQGAVHGAESAIGDARELCYMLLERLPDPGTFGDGDVSEVRSWDVDLLRDQARRWLDQNGRNKRRELVLRGS